MRGCQMRWWLRSSSCESRLKVDQAAQKKFAKEGRELLIWKVVWRLNLQNMLPYLGLHWGDWKFRAWDLQIGHTTELTSVHVSMVLKAKIDLPIYISTEKFWANAGCAMHLPKRCSIIYVIPERVGLWPHTEFELIIRCICRWCKHQLMMWVK